MKQIKGVKRAPKKNGDPTGNTKSNWAQMHSAQTGGWELARKLRQCSGWVDRLRSLTLPEEVAISR